MNQSQCPNCKSTNVKVYSKQKYFTRAAVLLVVTIVLFSLAYYLYDYLRKYDDRSFDDRAGLGSMILYGIGAFFSATFGLFFFIRGVFIKGVSYKCRFCKYKATEFLQMQKIKFSSARIKKWNAAVKRS